MEQFRTRVSIQPVNRCITLNHQLLTLGSCFSDAIGAQLQASKFNTFINPLGVLYNPISIHKTIRQLISNEPVPDHTFLQHLDVHLNYDFHSAFSSLSRPELEQKLKTTLARVHTFLKDCQWLIITYGTAKIYERVDTGEVVANCHKMPASLFSNTLITETRMLQSFEEMYTALKKFNPHINIILTVSPVRHLKETLMLNSVSKSTLRLGCHAITSTFKNVEYFPSYEIMMDDLRDYRFYKSDMIHPTEQAEEYIWEKFVEQYIDPQTQKFIHQWKSIRTALQHKPFHPTSVGHQIFLKQTVEKLKEFKNIVNVEEEIRILQLQIKST